VKPRAQSARRRRGTSIALFLALLLTLDIGTAQIAKRTLSFWNDAFPSSRHHIRSDIYHHDLAPSQDILEAWGPIRYRYATNSLGFKDASPRQVPLQSPTPRLLLMGDSFTQGVGFDFSTSMAGRIAQGLSCLGVEVLNAGLGGYAPSVYWRKIDDLLNQRGLKVDHVAVFLDISDMRDEIEIYHEDEKGKLIVPRQKPDSRITRFGHVLRDNSALARLFTLARDKIAYLRKAMKRRYETAKALGKPSGEVSEADMAKFATVPHKASNWTYDEKAWKEYGEAGRAKAAANMDKLAKLLEEKGLPLTLVVYPWPDQIFRDPEAPRHQQFWKDWAEAHKASFISLFPAFTQLAPEQALQTYFIPGDFHWNEAGNGLAAQAFLAQFHKDRAACP
jgi:hypothetical protein